VSEIKRILEAARRRIGAIREEECQSAGVKETCGLKLSGDSGK